MINKNVRTDGVIDLGVNLSERLNTDTGDSSGIPFILTVKGVCSLRASAPKIVSNTGKTT